MYQTNQATQNIPVRDRSFFKRQNHETFALTLNTKLFTWKPELPSQNRIPFEKKRKEETTEVAYILTLWTLPFILTKKKHFGRYIYGNRANEHMNVEELNALERYLEIWMYNIRSAKVTRENSQNFKKYSFRHWWNLLGKQMQIMIQEIQALKSKACPKLFTWFYKHLMRHSDSLKSISVNAGRNVESC